MEIILFLFLLALLSALQKCYLQCCMFLCSISSLYLALSQLYQILHCVCMKLYNISSQWLLWSTLIAPILSVESLKNSSCFHGCGSKDARCIMINEKMQVGSHTNQSIQDMMCNIMKSPLGLVHFFKFPVN